ncbi:MAG: cbb3-type cytochrome oxidase assembly protein CcoS [Oligoflexia bacterium]|nr:cbb3-type cytochrome oxidase assembly protein CcoS [Oligoflexia bacterium]
MNILFLLIPIATGIGIAGVIAFIYAVRKGQFDDLSTPAYRILVDESERKIDELDSK